MQTIFRRQTLLFTRRVATTPRLTICNHPTTNLLSHHQKSFFSHHHFHPQQQLEHHEQQNNNNNTNKQQQKRQDSPEYLEKQQFYRQFIQMYGRQAIRDALLQQKSDVQFHMIHVSHHTKNKGIIPEILSIAKERNIPIKFYTDEKKLMIISRAKNESMVQGIVADVKPVKKELSKTVDAFVALQKEKKKWSDTAALQESEKHDEQKYSLLGILALDSVMTPKNVGVILRTVAASGIDACLLPAETEGQVSVFHPEVIRTSTGSAFRAHTIRCERRKHMKTALCQLVDELNALILVLTPPVNEELTTTVATRMRGSIENSLPISLFDVTVHQNPSLVNYSMIVYVVGSETLGVSKDIVDLCADAKYKNNFKQVYIPMASNVESLNASSAATLCCYQHYQLVQ